MWACWHVWQWKQTNQKVCVKLHIIKENFETMCGWLRFAFQISSQWVVALTKGLRRWFWSGKNICSYLMIDSSCHLHICCSSQRKYDNRWKRKRENEKTQKVCDIQGMMIYFLIKSSFIDMCFWQKSPF